MASRDNFHQLLVDVLGSRNVYFQPPESIRMNYPCIKYDKDNNWTLHADDSKFIGKSRYTVTLIDYDPDSDEFNSKLNEIPYSSLDRTYTADNLNHFVYTIYF